MPSSRNVQNTHISAQLRDLHRSVLDIVAAMNRPARDEFLIKAAGIPLDRALFPLLVGIERRGPIGVVELAAGAGRDHTTVSRQVAKLEGLGLVTRRSNPADRRIREAVVTDRGRAMTDALDAARARLAKPILARWSEDDLMQLTRLLRRFTDDLKALSAEAEETRT